MTKKSIKSSLGFAALLALGGCGVDWNPFWEPQPGGTGGQTQEFTFVTNTEKESSIEACNMPSWSLAGDFAGGYDSSLANQIRIDNFMVEEFDQDSSPYASPMMIRDVWTKSDFHPLHNVQGADSTYADRTFYLYFSGHGTHNKVMFAKGDLETETQAACQVNLQSDMRLGTRMDPAWSRPSVNDESDHNWFQIFSACCTGYVGLEDHVLPSCNPSTQTCTYDFTAAEARSIFQTMGQSKFGQWFGFGETAFSYSAWQIRDWWGNLKEHGQGTYNVGNISSAKWWGKKNAVHENPIGVTTYTATTAITTGEGPTAGDALADAQAKSVTGNLRFPYIGPTPLFDVNGHPSNHDHVWEPSALKVSYRFWYDSDEGGGGIFVSDDKECQFNHVDYGTESNPIAVPDWWKTYD